MQGILLVMCLVFRARQHAAGLDDFGRPLHPSESPAHPAAPSSEPGLTTPALEAAVGDAVHSDVRTDSEETAVEAEASEASPLLPKQNGAGERRKGLFGWLKR